MLEYVKTVLSKVSFNKDLFEKELRKALNMLIPEELAQLKNWCYKHYNKKYPMVLQEVFN
jgi:predicted SprT family Zn-dependent metalloprotease